LLAGDEKAVVTRRLKYKRKVVKKKKNEDEKCFLLGPELNWKHLFVKD
jgi:hypothetical protein